MGFGYDMQASGGGRHALCGGQDGGSKVRLEPTAPVVGAHSPPQDLTFEAVCRMAEILGSGTLRHSRLKGRSHPFGQRRLRCQGPHWRQVD